MAYVNGTPNVEDRELERFIPSRKRQNELPFEQINVGKGLNKGFTAKPSGGFHDVDDRQYFMPKNVDQLRVANKPKLTYAGRVVTGKVRNDRRQQQTSN